MNNTEKLAQEIATLSAHLDAATHRLLQCIRSFDESGGWHEQGALSCAQWLSWRVGWDPGTARERVRVARALGTLPLIDEALRDWVREKDLQLGPETNMPRWDGTRPDYDLAVEVLLSEG